MIDKPSHKKLILPVMAVVSAIVGGCGGPTIEAVPLVRVRGIVTLDGEPLEKAIVVFESNDGSYSYAETDARGRYDLRFDSKTRGATLGEKTVRIATNRRIKGFNANDEGGPDDRAGGMPPKQAAERVPSRYNTESTLSVTVAKDARTFDFALTEN
jgi:hypothetical protein